MGKWKTMEDAVSMFVVRMVSLILDLSFNSSYQWFTLVQRRAPSVAAAFIYTGAKTLSPKGSDNITELCL
jgi:hypothetical protein